MVGIVGSELLTNSQGSPDLSCKDPFQLVDFAIVGSTAKTLANSARSTCRAGLSSTCESTCSLVRYSVTDPVVTPKKGGLDQSFVVLLAAYIPDDILLTQARPGCAAIKIHDTV
jgi:hypothetical protein